MKKLLFIIFLVEAIPGSSQHPLFIWPLKKMDSYSDIRDYYVVNNFVDSNISMIPTDWNCGNRTYNRHTGIDIDPWPFTWSMMDNDYVAVVAAAPGVVAEVSDNNNNDQNCSPPGNPPANFIRIRHADNSTSVYVHIKDNSARVTVGQSVAAGEIIALVGSSGNSSHPHLHFEVHHTDVGGYGGFADLIDPYSGNCNMLNADSWWQNQKPYWEPSLLRVMTHFAQPSMIGYNQISTCKPDEHKNAKAAFAPFDNIYFGIAMRDFLANQFVTLNVYYPNGNLWFSEPHGNVTGSNQPRWYTAVQKNLGSAPSGTYKMEVDFYGSKAYHFFTVNCPSSQSVPGPVNGVQGFRASGTITATADVTAGNNLILQAGSRVVFATGFSASGGSMVRARIRDCNYSE